MIESVAAARRDGLDWYLFDMGSILDRLATRRYIDSPWARPAWWTPYELPRALRALDPVPNTRFFRAGPSGRTDGGLFSLDGKVAVVTGGGRGIGVMIARGLLQAGAAKVYLAARKEAELESVVAELSPLGAVEGIPADLGTAEGVQTLADAVAAREDAVHVLFNNAGAAWGAPP